MKNKFIKLFKDPTFYFLLGAFSFIFFTFEFFFSKDGIHPVLDKGMDFFGALTGLVLIWFGFIFRKKMQ